MADPEAFQGRYSRSVAIVVILGWWFVNFIFDNIIRPRFMKKGLHIPISMIIVGLMV